MGKKGRKGLIIFSLLLVAYLVLLNIYPDVIIGYDEARHTNQGYIFYEYFSTWKEGGDISLNDFAEEYIRRGYNAGWYGFYDPPFHAITQAIMFSLFGKSIFAARFATQLLVVIGSFGLFFLCRKVFAEEEKFRDALSIAAVFTFLFIPGTVGWAGQAILTIPIALFTVTWFYLTFYAKRKYVSIGITKNWKVRIDLNLVWGALFLTGATLMKYPTLIYASVFVASYIGILLIVEWRETSGKIMNHIVNSKAFDVLKRFAAQGMIFGLLAAGWIKLALLDREMVNIVLFWGISEGKDKVDPFYYLQHLFTDLHYITFLALIPIVFYFLAKDKKETFLYKHWVLLLFVVTTTVTATKVVTHQQLRYAWQMVPFVSILIIVGVLYLLQFALKKMKNAKMVSTVILLALVFGIGSFVGLQVMNHQYYSSDGVRTLDIGAKSSQHFYELADYVSEISDPKLVVYVRGREEASTYPENPDIFTLAMKQAAQAEDPRRLNQFISIAEPFGYKEFSSPEDERYSQYVDQILQLENQVSVVVVLAKGHYPRLEEPITRELSERGYGYDDIFIYRIFSKSVPAP